MIYNVRLDKDRGGVQTQSRLREMKPKFAILYKNGHEETYHVFRIHDTAVMDKERMEASRYPNPKGKYFIFRFDEEVSIGKFDLKKLIGIHRLSHADYQDGAPIFPTGAELLKYRL